MAGRPGTTLSPCSGRWISHRCSGVATDRPVLGPRTPDQGHRDTALAEVGDVLAPAADARTPDLTQRSRKLMELRMARITCEIVIQGLQDLGA
jgi:hypothetical protein